MDQVRRGTIQCIRGSWGSGLAMLHLKDPTGVDVLIPCESAVTARLLDLVFDDVIVPGHHVVNPRGGHIGQDVYYQLDEEDFVLDWIFPVDRSPVGIHKAYRASVPYLGEN